jgi:TatA/E family protein of Tat protein translocase
MISIPDMAILGVLALLVFGEKRLPEVMRKAGRVMREVQNTSQSFIREMERAADITPEPRRYEEPEPPHPPEHPLNPEPPPTDATNE